MALSIIDLDIQVLPDSDHQECKIHFQIPASNRCCGDRISHQHICYLLSKTLLFLSVALSIIGLGILTLEYSDHQSYRNHHLCQA